MDLGVRRDNDEKFEFDSQILARHAAMLGSTGSGKTVMAKALIEECTIDDIPSLIIDPQGDLARLCINATDKEIADACKITNVTNSLRNDLIQDIDETINHLISTGELQKLYKQGSTKIYGKK